MAPPRHSKPGHGEEKSHNDAHADDDEHLRGFLGHLSDERLGRQQQ